jgi:16S rRNA G1207 methylase RsmC
MPFIQRYPETKNSSLQPFNAADQLLLTEAENLLNNHSNIALINDRFGFLTCHLAHRKPFVVIGYKSQEKAVRANLLSNKLEFDENLFLTPLDDFPDTLDIALVKIPKSLELFRLHLYQIHQSCGEQTMVLCGFMTKYFSKQLLKIAGEFFSSTEQSRARKKARLLILKKPKPNVSINLTDTIYWNGLKIVHYPGVFSSGKIDYATQFLLRYFTPFVDERRILDMASGNGVIAAYIQRVFERNGWALPEIHLTDDNFTAVESSKLNLPDSNCRHHFSDDLLIFEDDYFDLIVTNPPFHFGHEINTEVSMNLFTQVQKKLNPDGRFVLVFNRHLVNYRTLLKRLFPKIILIADSPRYMALECRK